ncbi:hypothetical protein ACGYK5_15305 [Sulfitobacter sp. 1A16787]|uniref:hypothetical protein n=1 Tax=Sulfitobacter sp. 1A16787 TaxID=3368571 RepID=UPI0037462FF9
MKEVGSEPSEAGHTLLAVNLDLQASFSDIIDKQLTRSENTKEAVSALQVYLSTAKAIVNFNERSGLTKHFWFKDEALITPIFQGQDSYNVEARELAHMSVVFCENRSFFKENHGIFARHCKDANGSGNQSRQFEVLDESGGLVLSCYMTFMPSKEKVYVYEADLFKDQRKDYLPGKCHGKHRFDINSLQLTYYGKGTMCDWVSEAYPIVRDHAELLGPVREDLISWTEAGLSMKVICGNFSCRHISIIPVCNLLSYRRHGEVLASLRKRLTCGRCGHRGGSSADAPTLLPTILNPTKTIRRPAWRDI